MGGRHTSHSVVLVPKYLDDGTTVIPGLNIIRHMTVFGYDDAVRVFFGNDQPLRDLAKN